MKKLIKDRKSRLHVYLIRPLVILMCWSLALAPVSANQMIEIVDDGGGGGGGSSEPTLQEKIDMAKAGLVEIRTGQLTEYYPNHSNKYFFANGISQINSALGVSLNESYVDYKAGDNPVILGQADIKGTNIGFRIKETGEPYLYKGSLPDETPSLPGGGMSLLSIGAPVLPIHSSPVIVNLDADPEGELIFADDNGDLYAWNYSGGTWGSFFPSQPNGLFAHTETGIAVKGTPAIANIDKDGSGIMEVVVGNASGKVYAWHAQDTSPADGLADLILGFPVQAMDSTGAATDTIDNSVVLEDINNDTNFEIVAVGTGGGINIWNNAGTRIGSAFGYPSIVNSSPAVGDINKDGFSEIITAHSTRICAWNYNGSSFIPAAAGRFFDRPAGQGYFNSSPALADVDGDGILEVVIVTSTAHMYALNEDASYVDAWPSATGVGWPKRLGTTSTTSTSSVAVGNIATYGSADLAEYNQDLEMVAATPDGQIYAMHHDGTAVVGWPVDRTNDPMTTQYDSSPALVDIDNNGDVEVIIGCWNGNLYGYHHDDLDAPLGFADPVIGFPKTGMGAIELSSPSVGTLGTTTAFKAAIADLSGNAHIWDLAAPSTTMPWPKFRHDLKNTGTYLRADRVIPTLDSVGPFSVGAGSALNFTVVGHDTGIDPKNVTDISAFNLPSGATFTFNDATDSGSFSWPSAVAGGPYTVTFIDTDTHGLHSAKLNVVITVTANGAPVANIDSYILNEDVVGGKIVAAPGVLTNDTDPNGDPLTADRTGGTGPSHGTLTAFGTNGSFTYVPTANYNGTDTFTYRAFDGSLYSAYAAVTLIVSPVPDAPEAVNDTANTTEEQAVDIYVLANDRDVDGDSFAIYDFTQPANGTVTRNVDILRYTPNPNFDGPTDTFTYRIQDSSASSLISSPGTVTVTIIPQPDPPVAVNDTPSTNEDTTIDVAVMANDYDPDTGDTISLNNIVTGPSHGTAAINGTNIRYIPTANYNGSDSFTYNIKDSTNRISNTATVSMTVVSVPDNPVAVNDTDSTAQGVAKDVAVMANDYDADTPYGDSISLNSVVAQPSHGTAAINGTNIRYTPTAGYSGADSFTYNIKDSTARISNTATVSMTISANPPPVANNDTYSTNEGTALNQAAPGVLSNDTDDGPITAVLSATVGQGTLTLNANGSFLYTPAANWFGTTTFTYRAYDGTSYSNVATVTITVTQLCDDAPTAVADTYSTNEDVVLSPSAPGVLSNDTNNESGTTMTAVLVSTVGQGTLTLNANGSFTYTPAANWFGSTSFVYKARSSSGICGATTLDSANTTVTITVTQLCDDAPTAVADTYSTNEDTALNIAAAGVLTNDTNRESGTTLSAVKVADPTHGTVTLNANGSFTYTPTANYFGADNFTYKARSSSGVCTTPIDSSAVVVAITVTQRCDDTPIAAADSYSTNEGIALNQAAPGVLSNDTNNESGTTLSAVLVTTVAHGTLTLNANGSFVYTPTGGYTGPDSFVYKARSSSGICGATNLDSANATVSLSVNDACTTPPTAVADTYSTNEGTVLSPAAPGVLTNDTNNEPSSTLTAVLVTTVTQGSLTLNANGSFTYTPAANWFGSTSFVYKARSSGGLCGTPLDSANTTVTITVTQLCDDAPTAVADTYSTNEDVVLSPSAPGVLSNDTNNESGTTMTAVLVSTVGQGTLTLNANGSFTYTPAANWFGSTSFVYKARSSSGICGATTLDSANTTVTITVTQLCDDAPTAVTDTYSTNEDTALNIAAAGVLTNDTNRESGTTLSAVKVADPTHGTVTLNANGSFTYTPTANYFGADNFTYKARSSSGVCTTPIDSSAVVVAITVTQRCDDTPTAAADSYSVGQNSTLNTAAPGVLSNDTNRESGTTLSAVLVTTVAHGTLTLNANGSFVYTPTGGYTGPDSFVYKARSSSGICGATNLDSANATVSLTVTVDPAPVASNDTYSTNEDTALNVAAPGVLSNDTDDDPITAVLSTTVSHGTLTLNANGSFVYTPAANYFGADSFTYRAYDGISYSNTATVSITVTQRCDDAPTATADSYTTNINTALSPAAPGVLGNDTNNESGTTLSAIRTGTGIINPTHGTLSFNSNGSFTYTPTAGYIGTDTFTYKARSSGGVCTTPIDSSAATVTINIISCTPPTSNPDTYYSGEDQTILGVAPDVLENDTDPYGQPMTAVLVTNVSHGSLTFNTADGSFSYTPAANWYGEDGFTYKAVSTCGGGTQGNIAQVRLIISQRCDDPPIANNDSYTANENTTLSVVFSNGVVINDLNPESPTWNFGSVRLVSGSGPSHGTLSLSSNGSFTYTPTTGYLGPDTFRYQVSNSCTTPLWSNEATVTITVGQCSKRVKLYNASGVFVACFDNIQPAIDYTSMGTGYRITAAPGIYNERLAFNINKSITVESTSGNAADTIISGQSLGTVVNFMPAAATTTFRGFGVAYGLTSGNGGGIIINNAPVNIQNCDIIDNTANGATSKGGGIYINSTLPTVISGTEIYRNRATDALSDAVYVSGTGTTSFVGTNIIRHSTGGGGGGCLLPGTKIAMADGTMKAIENVILGDKVLGVTSEGKTVASEVTKTFPHPQMKGYFIIETEDGKTLNVTAIHPIYNGKEFVEASTLKVGDDIVVTDNKDSSQLALKKIAKIEKKDSIVDVYNLEVEPHHTYIAEGVVVHNKTLRMMMDAGNTSGPN